MRNVFRDERVKCPESRTLSGFAVKPSLIPNQGPYMSALSASDPGLTPALRATPL
ncbi:MAG: hypothetical protein KBF37_11385 [Saprospiraceae bacterium]|nr:hypothetical protein [Saprospiraceae bacterium]